MTRRPSLPLVGLIVMTAPSALGQLAPGGPSAYQPASSYSDYYSRQLQTSGRPSVNPRQYTVDKYFYHRPTVSPYLNLTRRSGRYTNNYYQYVQPEIARRQSAAVTTGTSGTVTRPNTGNAYYSQWYSQRQQLGLR